MSGYAIILNGENIRALVVGAGKVAARKTRSLLDAGASVHVVAPEISPAMSALIDGVRARLTPGKYTSDAIGDANIIFAATNSSIVNSAIASDARERGLIVNVASAAEEGDFATPATHRDGELLISVYAGGVPAAAVRVRDAIALSLDAKVGDAIAGLAALRNRHLARGESSLWEEASRELIGDDFLISITTGEFARRLSRWG